MCLLNQLWSYLNIHWRIPLSLQDHKDGAALHRVQAHGINNTQRVQLLGQ